MQFKTLRNTVLNIIYSMSRTSSQLITAFTEAKQNMQLNADKKKLVDFQNFLKERRKKIEKDAP